MGDFVPRFEQRESDHRSFGPSQLPTSGAVPVKNAQGKVVMQKVKVQRYVAGKMPVYANEDESSDEEEKQRRREARRAERDREREREDRHRDDRDRHRHRDDDRGRRDDRRRSEDRDIVEPEILREEPEKEEQEDQEEIEERRQRARMRRLELQQEKSDDEERDDAEDNEEEFERRRRLLRERARMREEEEMRIKKEVKEEVVSEQEEDEETSEEESSDEEEDRVTLMKPVFVRKKDRITLTDAENEKRKLEQQQKEEERQKEERRLESIRIAQQIRREEDEMDKRKKEDNIDLQSVLTDDESEELAYEAWKLREMKRLKRDREEREIAAREKAEIEKIHSMTEEERKAWIRANPKIITNKQDKGKYKFLQKYFHRGVFFLDEEEDVKKQDFAAPTLEDQFDKTVLPKVMQVKNFGKASRTKWTHLTAEDTTDHQGAWNTPTAQNTAFFNKKAGGTRAVFDRPGAKKRKTE
ncbi:unnamed protein product, partial [Mesorhabditis spiculigera]